MFRGNSGTISKGEDCWVKGGRGNTNERRRKRLDGVGLLLAL